jgi:hypothetical protein
MCECYACSPFLTTDLRGFRDHGPALPTAAPDKLTRTQWLVELTLHAIAAPTEELAEQCVELAQQVSAKLSSAEVAKALKVASAAAHGMSPVAASRASK